MKTKKKIPSLGRWLALLLGLGSPTFAADPASGTTGSISGRVIDRTTGEA
jgi:hypothetical protein